MTYSSPTGVSGSEIIVNGALNSELWLDVVRAVSIVNVSVEMAVCDAWLASYDGRTVINLLAAECERRATLHFLQPCFMYAGTVQ